MGAPELHQRNNLRLGCCMLIPSAIFVFTLSKVRTCCGSPPTINCKVILKDTVSKTLNSVFVLRIHKKVHYKFNSKHTLLSNPYPHIDVLQSIKK